MAGDSLMDDPSSITSFLDWMGTQVENGRSPVPINGEIVDKEIQSPVPESRPNGSLSEESQPHVHPVLNGSSPEILNGASSTPAEVAQPHEVEAVFQSNPDSESGARSSIVSVAHQSTQPAVTPASKLASADKVEHNSRYEPLPSPSISTQTETIQTPELKVTFRYRNALPNSFNQQDRVEVKREEIDHQPSREDVATLPEVKPEDSTRVQKVGPVVPKRGNTLHDSVYATRQLQQRPRYPSMTLQQEGGEQYDPMGYFDNKRKEYYPTSNKSNSGSKAMLQSKDPNVSMTSPRKAVSRLDPQAKEYHIAEPTQKSVEKTAEVHEESMSSIIATPKSEAEPMNAAAVSKVESNTTESQPDVEATADKVETSKANQQEEAKKTAQDSFVICQDIRQADERMDLTPMLNVLGARSLNAPETDKQKMDEVNTTIEEDKSPIITSSEQDVPEKAMSRTLTVKNLPDNSDYTFVQSVIHGATIMNMKLMQDKNQAQVQLTDTDDCRKVVESCEKGVEIKHKGRMHKILVEYSSEVGEADEVLEIYLNCGATRAVQAEGVDLDMTMRKLQQVASGPTSREVEAIHDSFSGGIRKVVFRFTSIQDAVAFRSSLRRDTEWKTKKIEFVDDPCA